MKQEDKLRNTLREYYDNQEVPFNDEDWLGASVKLSQARRKKRIGRYAIIFTATILIWAALFSFFFNSQKPMEERKHLAKSLPHKNTYTNRTPEPIIRTSKTQVQKTDTHLKQNKNSNKLSQPAIISTTKTREKVGWLPPTLPATSTSPIPAEQMLLPAMQEPELKEGPEASHDPLATPITHENMAGDNSDAPKLEVPGGKTVKEETATIFENLSQDPTPAIHEMTLTPSHGVAIAETSSTLTNAKQETTAPTVMNSSIPNDTLVNAIKSVGIQVPIVDTTNDTETIESTTSIHPIEPLTEGFFLETGAVWFNGWKGSQARDARGFSPILGLNYMSSLSNRSSFSFGIAYVLVPNLSNSSKTSRVSTYEYGEQSNVTVITPSSVHYLVAPLRLHYVVRGKNSLGIGVNLAWLLNVNSNITTYKEIPGSRWDYKNSKLSGYTEGFSVFDSQLAFCYRRRFSSSLALQAEIFLGLTDVKQDKFFGDAYKEKNSGAKLSFIYNIFRKSNKQ